MRRAGIALALMAVAGFVTASFARTAEPKYTIKEVMEKAFKDMRNGLCAKVASGKASKEEKEELADLFHALAENKPPKGMDKSWEAKTKALADAADAIATKDDKAALPKLRAAANCQGCHSQHKPNK